MESGTTFTLAARRVSTGLPDSLVLPQPLISSMLFESQRAPSSAPAISIGVRLTGEARTR